MLLRRLKILKAAAINTHRAGEGVVEQAAKAGETKMKQLIETRGTGRTWSRPFYAKQSLKTGTERTASSPGRVNTGRMRDLVSSRVERGAVQTNAVFGWVNQKEKYFEYQENGFTAGGFRPPVNVPGMFALRDARLYVSQVVLPKLVRQRLSRIGRNK